MAFIFKTSYSCLYKDFILNLIFISFQKFQKRMQGEEKISLCSDCLKHGFPKCSTSLCQFCAHQLCDSHLNIHSDICPKKIQICYFCRQNQAVYFCEICFNVLCGLCFCNEQTWHEGNESHKVKKLNESLIELFEKKFDVFKKPEDMVLKQIMEGINLNDTFLTLREETVNMILEKLESFYSLLVRSPAFSGKTSLATLIVDKLKKQHKNVVFATMLSFIHSAEPDEPIHIGQPAPGRILKGKFKSFNEFWKSVSDSNFGKKFSFIEFGETIKQNNEEVYVILDETQMIYDIDEIWQCFKELTNASFAKLKLLCFAAYHRQTNDYPTPFQFNF